jgi:hypothetical protein
MDGVGEVGGLERVVVGGKGGRLVLVVVISGTADGILDDMPSCPARPVVDGP